MSDFKRNLDSTKTFSYRSKHVNHWNKRDFQRWILDEFADSTTVADIDHDSIESLTEDNVRLLLNNLDEKSFVSLDPNFGKNMYTKLMSYLVSNLGQNLQNKSTVNDEERKKKPDRTNNIIHCWEVFRDLLKVPEYNPSIVEWVDTKKLVFKINNLEEMCELYSLKKNKTKKMTYESISRSIRKSRERSDYFCKLEFKMNFHYQFGKEAVENCEYLRSLQMYANNLDIYQTEIPEILKPISKKDYNCIFNYFSTHRNDIIEKIRIIRNAPNVYYTNEIIDSNCDFILNYTTNAYAIQTTADGNCLFHAISIALFGNESQTYNIKLCTAFIIYDNQEFFRRVLQADGNVYTIEKMIEETAQFGIWGTHLTIIALNLLTLRPIYSYSNIRENSINTNITLISHNDLNLCIAFDSNINHFSGVLGTINSTFEIPQSLATRFWDFSINDFGIKDY